MPDTLSFLPLPAIRNRPCFCSGLRHALVRQSCFIIPSAHGVRCTHHLCWEQQQPASPKAPPMSWSLRCRGPSGQATLSGLSADSTLGDLQSQIHAQLGIAAAQQTLLSGFPPRPLDLGDPSTTLAAAGLQNGDAVTVRENPAAAPPPPPAAAAAGAVGGAVGMMQQSSLDDDAALAAAINASLADAGLAPAATAAAASPPRARPPAAAPAAAGAGSKGAPGPAPTAVQLEDGSVLVRRIIASDNSCLFNAVGYVTEGRRDRAAALRGVIAKTVAGDPFTYNEGFLEQENAAYCKWITDMSHWGGPIELSILAAHYGCQLAAYDIQTKRCDVYGQDVAGATDRALLIYDGLHYDALAVSAFAGAPEELDVTRFPAEGPQAAAYQAAAEQLVAGCHAARQFTDTATFTLRCSACMLGLKGAKEAQEHAAATGHTNFTEY